MMFNRNKKNQTATQINRPNGLRMEPLEDRMMLSGVEVFAAGDLGGEQFALNIDGQTVEIFTVCLLYTSPSPRDRG